MPSNSLMYIELDEPNIYPTATNCTFYNNKQKIKFSSGDKEILWYPTLTLL